VVDIKRNPSKWWGIYPLSAQGTVIAELDAYCVFYPSSVERPLHG
jgi:hypothetical protein